MQFIPNGPDIHDALLHAHEEGRVVFFCGAGISYPAGLPDFKGLVDKIYKIAGTTHSDLERKADDRGQFDTTLEEHMERSVVRRAPRSREGRTFCRCPQPYRGLRQNVRQPSTA